MHGRGDAEPSLQPVCRIRTARAAGREMTRKKMWQAGFEYTFGRLHGDPSNVQISEFRASHLEFYEYEVVKPSSPRAPLP